MSKELTFGDDARIRLLKGATKLKEAVATTLGPRGKIVLISRPMGGPIATKDGVSVAKSVALTDPIENLGAQIIKEASEKTSTEAGDGTTTATVVAHAILEEGMKRINNGMDENRLFEGIKKGQEKALAVVSNLTIPVKGIADIEHVATVSANNDSETGKLIAKAFNSIGSDGVVTVEESKTTETTIDYVDGMELSSGYLSNLFANQPDSTAVYQNPRVLLSADPLMDLKPLLFSLDPIFAEKLPILIIAESYSKEVLDALILNKIKGAINVVAVKPPGVGQTRKDVLYDIAAITGATVIDHEQDRPLSSFQGEYLGECDKVISSINKTTIVAENASDFVIDERVELIKQQLTNTTVAYEIEKLKERLAKLSGGIAILRVGAYTEAELKEKKHRVEDALSATRAAIDGGIVPGGGTALLRASNEIDKMARKEKDAEVREGLAIIRDSIRAPFKRLVQNASRESVDILMAKVLRQTDKKKGLVYSKGEFKVIDVIKAGVVDPANVELAVLRYAVSAALTLLKVECTITRPEDTMEGSF